MQSDWQSNDNLTFANLHTMSTRLSTAVILAARREHQHQTPYPLEPLADGVTLLSRTLSLLEQLNYKRIFIVTGYQAELFTPYAQKDSRIQLVQNPDYAFTASMGSLAHLEGLIDEDFLLIEGDTFYEARVLEELTEITLPDCLCLTEESGSGDEAFVELEQKYLLKVSKDRHQLSSIAGELLGIIRLSRSTFSRMLELWHRSTNPLLNYEYAFLDVTTPLGRPTLFFSDLIWGDVDTEADLHHLINYTYPRLIRKENPLNLENLCEHLSKIFETDVPPQEVKISPIGGMSNKNFKVEYADKLYVLRLPGAGSETMVDRSNEQVNSLLASELGINPPIRYFSAESGIKLADFIQGAQALGQATIQRTQNLKQIATILRLLHGASFRLSNDFNGFTELRKYEHTLTTAYASRAGSTKNLDIVPALQARINELGVTLAPCHNDLVPENFIISTTGELFLIDWEYSGMNDPHWDIAALFLESRFSEEAKAYFFAHYFPEGTPKDSPEKILIYQILMDLLWSLWTDIKEAEGEDFGSYGSDRYARALTNIKLWEEDYG